MQIRLQKLLSASGVASRRAAEQLILEGRVSVNGTVVRELGTRADPDCDEIRIDDRRIRTAVRRRYFLLNKPRGYVTTRADPEGRPTILDLLPPLGYLYPVGRLDYDSEGLLLVTNDGELTARLTHPRHGVERVYEVRVRGVPSRATVERLARGVTLEGRRTAPADVRLRRVDERDQAQAVLQVTLHEGRQRQVRKMCEAVGHPVVRLRRVRIGPLRDPSLRPGEFRQLTARELQALKRAAGLGGDSRSFAADPRPAAARVSAGRPQGGRKNERGGTAARDRRADAVHGHQGRDERPARSSRARRADGTRTRPRSRR